LEDIFAADTRALGEVPNAHRVLASRRRTPSDCPGTPRLYAKGYSHYSRRHGASRRRAPRGLGWAWAGRGTPPRVPGGRPARRLPPSILKSTYRPDQTKYHTRRAPESTRAAAMIGSQERRCRLYRAPILFMRGVADALRQGRCRDYRWRFSEARSLTLTAD
jgi:hypothetical protein